MIEIGASRNIRHDPAKEIIRNLEVTRFNRQQESSEKWRINHGKGTLEAVTGYGKTVMALFVMYRMWLKKHTILVVVPTKFLLYQWRVEIDKWGLHGVDVVVINSAVKIEYMKYDLLVLDEIHKYKSPIFKRIFEIVNYKWILGLTATMSDGDPKYELIREKCPIIDTVTFDEALDNDWISPFKVYNLGLDIHPLQVEEYRKINESFNKLFAWFGHDFKLAQACLNNKQTRTRYAEEQNLEVKQVYRMAFLWNKQMQARKDILYGGRAKLVTALDIISRADERNILTFAQKIDQADTLARILNQDKNPPIAAPYHSKLKGREINGEYYGVDRYKQYLIDKFADPDDDLRIITSAESLDLGANLPFVDLGLVLSGTSKVLQGTQRTGRVVRKVNGKHALYIELYYKGTADERWLRSRQKELPRYVIHKIESVDEIVELRT